MKVNKFVLGISACVVLGTFFIDVEMGMSLLIGYALGLSTMEDKDEHSRT